MHPQQLLQPGVVGIQVGVADRPAWPLAFPLGSLEFVVGEAQGDASPGEALAPHLAPPAP